MNNDKLLEKIIIVDYGSQFTQLIARKVRECGVYSEIINFNQINKLKKDKNKKKGIILSGGPLTITNKESVKLGNYILNLNIPILGICYGHQILAKKFGGKVKISKSREFGHAVVRSKSKSSITKNFFRKKIASVWMSHQDVVYKLPSGFKKIASTNNSKFAIIANEKRKYYGIQFHPEVNLRMHFKWLYYAGYMLREKGAQKKIHQLNLRVKHGKKINMWLDYFLDNYFLKN